MYLFIYCIAFTLRRIYSFKNVSLHVICNHSIIVKHYLKHITLHYITPYIKLFFTYYIHNCDI